MNKRRLRKLKAVHESLKQRGIMPEGEGKGGFRLIKKLFHQGTLKKIFPKL